MILLIDTSTSELRIALASNSGELCEHHTARASEHERGIHDARLALEVKNLLERQSLRPQDIQKIAVIIGPGSFTGLRIGLSFVKGFVFASSAALVPISLHEVLTYEAGDKPFDVILTPGYQKSLVYLSHEGSPNTIELIEIRHFLTETTIHTVLGDPSLEELFSQSHKVFVPCTFSMASFAAVAAKSEGATRDEIAVLEPLYVAEFKIENPKR